MSESDSDQPSSNESESEEISDEGDVVEGSVFQPYRFEPEAGGDYVEPEHDEDGIPRIEIEIFCPTKLMVSVNLAISTSLSLK